MRPQDEFFYEKIALGLLMKNALIVKIGYSSMSRMLSLSQKRWTMCIR